MRTKYDPLHIRAPACVVTVLQSAQPVYLWKWTCGSEVDQLDWKASHAKTPRIFIDQPDCSGFVFFDLGIADRRIGWRRHAVHDQLRARQPVIRKRSRVERTAFRGGRFFNRHAAALEPFPFRWDRNGGPGCLFDAFSSREPASTPDQVRGGPSLENALLLQARIGSDGRPAVDYCAPNMIPFTFARRRAW